jgi:hypothetical protein
MICRAEYDGNDRLPIRGSPSHHEMVDVLADVRSRLGADDLVIAEHLDRAVDRDRARLWPADAHRSVGALPKRQQPIVAKDGASNGADISRS